MFDSSMRLTCGLEGSKRSKEVELACEKMCVRLHASCPVSRNSRVALRARGTRSDTVQKSLAGVVYSVGASFSDSPMCGGVAPG